MSKLTHFNKQGSAHMVDIGDKAITRRLAIASGSINMQKETISLIKEKKHKKGDVLGIAQAAGIMAAKKTSELIPLCHPLSLTHINIDLSIDAYSEPATDDKMFGDYDPYEAYFGSNYKYSSSIEINLDE